MLMNPGSSDARTTGGPTIAPEGARAEFRVFGQGIIEMLEPRIWNGRTVLQRARAMPRETYLVSCNSRAANVKVRDGLLDVKSKVGETRQGYEIFKPTGKFAFPLQRPDLLHVLGLLDVEMPRALVAGSEFPCAQLLRAARRHPDLVLVDVEKTRWGFTIDGVICEYADVSFNGARLESACVESENHAAMERVIAELGLQDQKNLSYPAAIAGVMGFGRP